MRGTISALTSAALVLCAASVVAAQEPRKEAPPARTGRPDATVCYSTDNSRSECRALLRSPMDSVIMKRAILGLQMSPTGSTRDTIGVFVARVTPKGPAENAGIIEGERIVSINGVDLRLNAADAGDSYASDLPSRRLTREVEKLSPGNVATLRVASGGRIRDVRVTAGKASDFHENGFGYGGGPDGFALRSFPRMSMEDFNMPIMRMEDMPPMRAEDMRKLEETLPRLRERMRETHRMMAPSRVRIVGPEARVYIYRDSAGTLRKSRTNTEKSRTPEKKEEKKK